MYHRKSPPVSSVESLAFHRSILSFPPHASFSVEYSTVRCVAIFTFIILNVLSLHAQRRLLTFERFTLAEGMSQSSVVAIEQDRDGYMWFGTSDGLNRYDGYSFKIYLNDPTDSTSLSDNRIRSIFCDRAGNMWIGTVIGLNLLKHGEHSFRIFEHRKDDSTSLSSSFINSVCEDIDGMIWIATSNGLNRMNPRTGFCRRYYYNPKDHGSVGANYIRSLLIDSYGSLWITTYGGGLNLYDRSTDSFKRFFNKNTNVRLGARQSFESIIEDSKKRLWITGWHGVHHFDTYTSTFTSYPFEPIDSTISDNNHSVGIAEDPTGILWIGTLTNGLFAFNPRDHSFDHYASEPRNPQALSDNYLFEIVVDRSGSLWVGTSQGGVNWADQQHQKFPSYKIDALAQNLSPHNYILALWSMQNRDVWVGTRNGIGVFDSNMILQRTYLHPKAKERGLDGDAIRGIIQDAIGTIWIGTDKLGVYRYDEKRDRFINYRYGKKPTAADLVFGFSKDRRGTIMVITPGGLMKIDEKSQSLQQYFDSSRYSHLLTRRSLLYAIEDRDGRYWLGYSTLGVLLFDPKRDTVQLFQNDRYNPNSLSNNSIWSIFADSRGWVWICTVNGLCKYEPKKNGFTVYTTRHGLPNNCIYGMVEDQEGKLWISTNYGLSHFDPTTSTFRNFDPADGLQDYEFNQNAFANAADGKIFFGGIDGFNAFYPQNIRVNSFIPPVRITNVKIFDKEIGSTRLQSQDSVLELSYQENVFSFEFVALNFSDPQKNRYAYKLEGFDEDWIYCGTRRYASYSNLSGGKYVFRVKAANNDGVWNEKGATMKIRIIAPPWKTWWAYVLYAFTVAGIVAAIVKVRERRLRAIELLRLRIASDLHDDIGSTLTKITMQTELLKAESSPDRRNAMLNTIANSSRTVITSMSDIVWSIDARNDSIGNLVDRMREFATSVLNEEAMSIHFSTEDIDHVEKLTVEKRQNMYLIFKEAVNNIAKHSDATEVHIKLSRDGNALSMEVRDNGTVQNDPQKKTGHGIRNMTMRAERIGGHVEIDTSRGYHIRVRVYPFKYLGTGTNRS